MTVTVKFKPVSVIRAKPDVVLEADEVIIKTYVPFPVRNVRRPTSSTSTVQVTKGDNKITYIVNGGKNGVDYIKIDK